MPIDVALATGTLSRILSFWKSMTNNSSAWPATYLLVDRDDLADAMRRIYDVLAGLEAVTLRRLFLLRLPYALYSLLRRRRFSPAKPCGR